MAIPNKIHYCWLSKEKMPDNYIKCIDSWKRIMPDYELVLWDSDKFDINSVPFVREAVSIKKWAFAADYIRLYAVYTEGGIYLDSDVLVLKKFDEFLKYDFFTSIEIEGKKDPSRYQKQTKDSVVGGCGLQAGIFGGIKGHPYLKSCMEWYENNSIFLPVKVGGGEVFGRGGDRGEVRNLKKIKSPDVMATVAQKYGFEYKYGEQKLKDGMIIFDTKVFCHKVKNATKGVYAIHWGEAGWFEEGKRFRMNLKRSKIFRLLTGKKPLPTLDDVIAKGIL